MAWHHRFLSSEKPLSASRRRFLGARRSGAADARGLAETGGQPVGTAERGAQPFLGEIAMFGGNFAPNGWALCQGQLLSIAQHSALFSLLGTIYGGDGRTTFALPDLRGRVPVSFGQGPGLSNYSIGAKVGTEQMTTVVAHSHAVAEVQVRGTGTQTTGLSTGGEILPPVTVTTGANTPPPGSDDNIQPVLAINYIISLIGIYPSRS